MLLLSPCKSSSLLNLQYNAVIKIFSIKPHFPTIAAGYDAFIIARIPLFVQTFLCNQILFSMSRAISSERLSPPVLKVVTTMYVVPPILYSLCSILFSPFFRLKRIILNSDNFSEHFNFSEIT